MVQIAPIRTICPVLAPYDLTRGGGYYNYFGHTDVKELALYIEDQIKAGNWLFNLGMRGDLYNGLAVAHQAEPRVGIAYNIKPTNTVLRISYARTLETPFNENLVLSSQGCSNAVLCSAAALHARRLRNAAARLPQRIPRRLAAGVRQECRRQRRVHLEVHAQRLRLQRARQHADHLSHRLAQLEDSRLRAACGRARTSTTSRAFVVMSSVAARFFPPQTAGAGATVGQSGYPFRIDHDEKFNQTTHLQYQFPARRAARGSASTGDTTAAWLPGGALLRRHRPIRIAPCDGDLDNSPGRHTGGRSERL